MSEFLEITSIGSSQALIIESCDSGCYSCGSSQITGYIASDFDTVLPPKIKPTNCSNCGAILKNGKCEFCGAEY